jgi:hypothetical protein
VLDLARELRSLVATATELESALSRDAGSEQARARLWASVVRPLTNAANLRDWLGQANAGTAPAGAVPLRAFTEHRRCP